MPDTIEGLSPGGCARLAGGLWLIVIITGAFALGTLSALVVGDDAAATARNVLGNESLFRLSFAANLVAALCYLGVTVLLYRILKPVSPTLSLLAAFAGLGGLTIAGPAYLTHIAPLVLLGGEQYFGTLTTEQLQALALVALKLNRQALNLSLVFFGAQCLLVGYLMVRSTFIPGILGLLLAIGGAGYVTGSFAGFLSPPLGASLELYVSIAALLGEGAASLWLLVKGLDASRWIEPRIN